MNFLALPAYRGADPLNFSPIQQGIESGQRNALARSQFDLQKRQADEQFMRQKMRDEEWAAIKSNRTALDALPPGLAPFVLAAGAEKGPDLATTGLFGVWKAKKDQGEVDARIRLYNAQAGAQNALAQARMQQGAGGLPVDPMEGYGIDDSGQFIYTGGGGAGRAPQARIPAQASENFPDTGLSRSMVLGEGATRAPGQRGEHADYGPIGTLTTGVPGIVTTPSGVPSQSAMQAERGQRATDSLPDQARQRAIDYKRTQDFWTYQNGVKAPSGMAFTADGKLISLARKESITDRQAIALAEQGLQALGIAERTLTGGRGKDGKPIGGSTYLSQYTGDTYTLPGGIKVGGFGEAGRGFKAAEMAILDLNFAISGKSVTNAEREHFQRLYLPTAGESLETQQWKLDRARAYFKSALAARKAGASDEELAGLFRKSLVDGMTEIDTMARQQGGSPQQPSAPQPGVPTTARPRDSMPPMQPGGGQGQPGWTDTPYGRFRRVE
jgi:hypothetical protein